MYTIHEVIVHERHTAVICRVGVTEAEARISGDRDAA
jgi:hypothetical protein